MDLALNNLQRLICLKPNQPHTHTRIYIYIYEQDLSFVYSYLNGFKYFYLTKIQFSIYHLFVHPSMFLPTPPPYEQDATSGQFLEAFNRFEFKVFLLFNGWP